MDEEKNITPEERENEIGSAPEDALENELEELKDTFQTVLDETAAEAENGQVIQELDYSADEPAAEASDNGGEDEQGSAGAPAKKKKDKTAKSKKRVPVAAIVIPVVLCILIIIPLLCYFVITIKEPDFNKFLAAYTTAAGSETAEERVTNYKAVLEYCGEEGFLAEFRQEALENIVVATCEASGYGAAYSYMTDNMTEEMIAAPKTKEFKQFLEAADSLDGLADAAYDKVLQIVGGKTDTSDIDYDAVLSEIGAPALLADELKTALVYIGTGVALENSADSKENIQSAISNYLNAYSAFSDMGADCSAYLEKIAIKLYDYGYAYETQLIIDNYIAGEEEYASENADFNAMTAELEAIKSFEGDIFTIAVNQAEMGKTTEDDFTALLSDAGLTEKAAKAVAQMGITVADAIKAEEEHNLTKASAYYSTYLSAAGTFGFPCTGAAEKAISILTVMGDTQSANSVKEQFFGEDAEISEAAQTVFDELDRLYNAQNNANEAFYPFYYNSAYYGSEMDKAEINTALDALITDSSNEYDKAFVEYYKYLAEAFTDADKTVMRDILESFAETMNAYPLAYGYSLAQLYQSEGEIDKALEVAEKMLEVNTADDFANSIKALALRADKKVDEALETARAGMELSGAVEYCAYEAAVDLLLKEEYEEAFELASELYSTSLTTNYCELIMIIAEKYDGGDESIKSELELLSAEINETYANYGIEASDEAKSIIDGTLTTEDVFLDGNYDFG